MTLEGTPAAHADDERQKLYFDVARNQYPRASVLKPPLHTVIEMDRVLAALDDVEVEGPVLDFGSGTGRLSIALSRAGYRVFAVDVSEASLDVLTGVAEELGLPTIRTAFRLPQGEHFGAIVGADVLHHVDLDTYLPQLHALLREGAKAVFSEPGGLNPAWYVYLPLFHDLQIEKRIFTCNPFTLRRSFERHGFRRLRITGLGLLPRPFFRWDSRACRWHDGIGNVPLLKAVAYRYIVEAWK